MKKYIFLFIVIFLWIGVFYKSKIFSDNRLPLKVKIVKSSKKIRNIDNFYVKSKDRVIYIDKLYFPNKKPLQHYLYGNLNFYDNFFIFINSYIELKKDMIVKFFIASDDGFRLKIDDKVVCEFKKDRPFKTTECKTALKKGKHKLFIKYFQGYGLLGLVGTYSVDKRQYYIGQNSDYIKFYETDK